ncbi:hypothetical protein [Actinomadura sp. WMMA1423]|uniref:hypothetical protein n=1 Tax=Actinomadura sp. WMMA1423 TaxID=2591108 RepID=UPI0011472A9D|nr:hypothetical protein [Actinomadura sp. WMMA1423]
MTARIRRDLDQLAQQQMPTRTRGGESRPPCVARICDPDEIDALVTDAAAPEPGLACFTETGVRV